MDLTVGDDAILGVLETWGSTVLTRVWLLHVAALEPDFAGYDEPGGPYDRAARKSELRGELDRLELLVEQVRGLGVEASRLLVRGSIVETIEQEAAGHAVHAILVGGGHRSRLGRMLTGSVVGGLLKRAGPPVIVAREGSLSSPQE